MVVERDGDEGLVRSPARWRIPARGPGGVEPAEVTPGGEVVYTITVVNHGPSAADGILVTDAIPKGAQVISMGSCQALLEPGAFQGGWSYLNVAEVGATTGDPVGTNNR